jgi:aryl-alcohol dehydrogenase-like predicted oxidoreductase
MRHIKRFCCGIPGAKNLRQAQENAGAIGWQMSAEEHKRVDEAVRF